jgi:hypothetical protein
MGERKTKTKRKEKKSAEVTGVNTGSTANSARGKTECTLMVPQSRADTISVRTAFKPVAQNETVTTMPHSPPIRVRQLILPNNLVSSLQLWFSTIPFPLTV